ncbi:MAG: LutC/YkgG family protein [Desulfomonilaceae bacterium]
MKNEELISIFMENAAKVGANLIRVDGISQLNEVLVKFLANETAVYCPKTTELEKTANIDANREAKVLYDATTTVEEVPAGIAETGSIVVTTANGRVVQTSLLPAHHIAILAAENIFPTLDDFFESIGNNPPTNITLITGPSRTADIELSLTIGVHGPGKVSIILI